jgi:hypothetical protein
MHASLPLVGPGNEPRLDNGIRDDLDLDIAALDDMTGRYGQGSSGSTSEGMEEKLQTSREARGLRTAASSSSLAVSKARGGEAGRLGGGGVLGKSAPAYGPGNLRSGREGKLSQQGRRIDRESRTRRATRAVHAKTDCRTGLDVEEGETEKDAALRASAARATAAVKEVGRLRVEVQRLQDALQRQREGQAETTQREHDLRETLESMKTQLTEARFGNDHLRAQVFIPLPSLPADSFLISLNRSSSELSRVVS